MSTKQEAEAPTALAAPEPGEYGEAPETHVCEEGSIWDEEQQACVPESEVQPDLGAELGTSTPAPTAVTESLMDSIVRTISDAMKQMETRLEKKINNNCKQIEKRLSGEAERTLRKSFGLAVDPELHRSDLARFARKWALEQAGTSKRSPRSPGKTGPDGNVDANKTTQSKKVESLFKQYKGEN